MGAAVSPCSVLDNSKHSQGCRTSPWIRIQREKSCPSGVLGHPEAVFFEGKRGIEKQKGDKSQKSKSKSSPQNTPTPQKKQATDTTQHTRITIYLYLWLNGNCTDAAVPVFAAFLVDHKHANSIPCHFSLLRAGKRSR